MVDQEVSHRPGRKAEWSRTERDEPERNGKRAERSRSGTERERKEQERNGSSLEGPPRRGILVDARAGLQVEAEVDRLANQLMPRGLS